MCMSRLFIVRPPLLFKKIEVETFRMFSPLYEIRHIEEKYKTRIQNVYEHIESHNKKCKYGSGVMQYDIKNVNDRIYPRVSSGFILDSDVISLINAPTKSQDPLGIRIKRANYLNRKIETSSIYGELGYNE